MKVSRSNLFSVDDCEMAGHFVAELTRSSKHRVPVLEGHRSCVETVFGKMKRD